ncbi:MAG: Bug family tripartite tricarboxylate transporter substrate binding protein [Betaproteobacteria bacterium]
MKTRNLVALALLACAGFATQAFAFPDKPVRIVLGFAPGGNVDIVNRIVGQAMGDELKQSVIIDNKAGANGAIGAEFVARAAPDGYTLFVTVTETHALNPALRKTLPYHPIKDFTSIGIVDTFAFALVLAPKFPASNVAGFIAYAKQNPGRLNFSSWGNGSLSQVAMEQLKQSAGIDLLHVPFKGSAPAMTALIAGQVEAFVAPLSLAVPYAADGRVKLVGVTSTQREDTAPGVPTLIEQGLAVDVTGWHVLQAPAGTPASAIATLNRALNTVLKRPDVRDRLLKAGVKPGGSTPQEAQALVESNYHRWGEVARKAGMKPD